MSYKILKQLRVTLAIVFLVGISLTFIDIYDLLGISQIKALVYLQFTPSLLSFLQTASYSAAGVFVVLIISALFGRIYCSIICPLGILNDVITYVARKRSSKKMFFKSKKALNWLRYPLLIVVVVSLMMGFAVLVTFLDPYSIAGRFFTYLLRPMVLFANNGIASVTSNSSSVYKMAIQWPNLAVLGLTVLMLVVIFYMAYKRGRLYCNTVCPVGTLLGLISKIAIFKVKIDKSLCSKCAKCVSVCKSECIDLKTQTIDQSRCVTCFNCVAICGDKAIDYRALRPAVDPIAKPKAKGRREAMATLLLIFAGSKLLRAQKEPQLVDGKLLVPEKRNHPVSPPGSIGIERFNQYCTGCGLCIASCPTKVLRPAYTEYGLKGFMQAHMDFSVGECNFNCTTCGRICPTGAILPVTQEEKQVLQMGKVVFVVENCVVYTDETDCGACSEHCPTKAVDMIPYKGNLMIPHINQDICVGCGSCEHPCPLPVGYKAIYVDGNLVHQIAQRPKEEQAVQKVQEDFPF